jgi:hypothetical protein
MSKAVGAAAGVLDFAAILLRQAWHEIDTASTS